MLPRAALSEHGADVDVDRRRRAAVRQPDAGHPGRPPAQPDLRPARLSRLVALDCARSLCQAPGVLRRRGDGGSGGVSTVRPVLAVELAALASKWRHRALRKAGAPQERQGTRDSGAAQMTAASFVTTCLPSGKRPTSASLNRAMPKGIPMIVR